MESTPYSKLFSRDSGKWLSRKALCFRLEEKMKEYGKKHWLQFVGVGLASVLLSAAMVGISLVLQYAIDFTMEGRVWEAVGMVASFLVLFAVLYGVRNVGFVSLNQKFLRDIRAEIVEKILRKDYLEFEERKESDYLSLLTNDVKKIEDDYLDTIFAILEKVVQLVLAIIVMTYYSWVFTVVMLGMTVAMFLIPSYFTKKLQDATEGFSQSQAKLTQGINEVTGGFRVIKSFRLETNRMSRFAEQNNGQAQAGKKLGFLQKANETVSNVLAFTMQMVICVLAAWFIFQGKMSYGSMVGVIQVSGNITVPLFGLFSAVPGLKALKPVWEKIKAYTANCESGEDAQCRTGREAATEVKGHTGREEAVEFKGCTGNKVDAGGTGANGGRWQEISAEHLGFSYPGSSSEVLKDVSLTIERGKKYLIVGESGGGKSTLGKLLCGCYPVSSGKIQMDNVDVSEKRKLLQEEAAVIWQDVFLFNESIKDNICLGHEDEKRLEQVLCATRLQAVVAEKGLDFTVGENGKQLSGGQRQRIAIARALYAGRNLLMLDEGFSALDPETAREIEQGLLENEELTVISISHHTDELSRKNYDSVIEVGHQSCRLILQ